MNPGELDKKIELQELVKNTDDEGIQNKVWETIRKPWAKVEYKIVRSTTEDNMQVSQVEINFIIRKDGTDLFGTKHRILFNSIVYEISDIAEQGNYWKIITKGIKYGNQA